MNFALLLAAAGRGRRLGSELPKALVEVGGTPLFVRAAEPFLKRKDCLQVVVAVPAESRQEFEKAADRFLHDQRVRTVAGGATRQESVAGALAAITQAVELVLVHDAARPYVDGRLIERVLGAVSGGVVAAVPGLPITDTVKHALPPELHVSGTIDREHLFTVQTPQAIRLDVFRQAHERARAEGFEGTDDVLLVERYGLGRVRLVKGDPGNVKLTTAEDLERARAKWTGSH